MAASGPPHHRVGPSTTGHRSGVAPAEAGRTGLVTLPGLLALSCHDAPVAMVRSGVCDPKTDTVATGRPRSGGRMSADGRQPTDDSLRPAAANLDRDDG